jgi:hypothetical protein
MIRLASAQGIERGAFHGLGEREPSWRWALRRRQALNGGFQRDGARVAHFVDPVAKSHQPFAAIQRRLDPRRCVRRRAYCRNRERCPADAPVMCSDGLCNLVTDPEICDVVSDNFLHRVLHKFHFDER